MFPYYTQRHQLFFHPYVHVVNDVDVPLRNLRYAYKMWHSFVNSYDINVK